MLKKEKKPKDDSEYIAKEINRMLNSDSYTKRDVRKFIEKNADKLSAEGTANKINNEVNQQKRDLLRKLAVFGAGAVGFTALSKLANADVLINANGVFKDGVEYSMGGIPYRIVAASNASDESKQKADYVCDGTNDEVEIQQAIDDLPTQGGMVFLTEGTFNISQYINLYKSVSIIGSGYGTTISTSKHIFLPQTTITYVILKNFNVNPSISVSLLMTSTYYGKKITKLVSISNIRNINSNNYLYVKPAEYGIGGGSSAGLLDWFIAENLYGKIQLAFSTGGKVYRKFISDSYVYSISENIMQSGTTTMVSSVISYGGSDFYSDSFIENFDTPALNWHSDIFFGTNININAPSSNISFYGTSSSKVKLVNSSIIARRITLANAYELSIENTYMSGSYYNTTNDFLIDVYNVNRLKLSNVVIDANSVSGNFIFNCPSSYSNGDFVADDIELVNASNITNLVNTERFNNVYIGSVRYV